MFLAHDHFRIRPDPKKVYGKTKNLEKICIDTVESGYMTKDLALLVGSDQPWLTTNQFLNKIDDNFKKIMSS